MTWEIREGDCRLLVPQIEPGTIDSIVCDPPYGLTGSGKQDARGFRYGEGGKRTIEANRGGFMGMKWDATGVAFDPETWRLMLDAAKPGAHLCAFGGSRTFHRMAVAIEDAGWEIRDTLCWLYGSGFPKSRRISLDMDRTAGAEREITGKANRSAVRPDAPDQSGGVAYRYQSDWQETAPASDAAKQWDGWGTALKPAHEKIIIARKPLSSMQERDTIVASLSLLEAQLWSLLPASIATSHFRLSQSEHDAACAFAQWNADERRNTLDGLCDPMDTLRFVSVMSTCLNIVSSWLSILDDHCEPMSMSIIETASSLTTDLKTLKSSLSGLTPRSIIQAVTKADGSTSRVWIAERCFSAVAAKWNGIRDLSVLANATDAGPENSPDAGGVEIDHIILARKPFAGTVAANVLTHGTGALNIDGCRIEGEPWKAHDATGLASEKFFTRGETPTIHKEPHAQGRWPANVVLDEESARLLDEQTGTLTSGYMEGHYSADSKGSVCYGAYGKSWRATYGDSGGASRFFYCSKAGRTERDAGLDDLPAQPLKWSSGDQNPGSFQSDGTNRTARNPHPTVKPVSLLRWLVRLVTPPGGLVLDPFAGSGSCGIAAVLESMRYIGIEADTEHGYAEIARRRIRYWEMQERQLPLLPY